MSRVVSLLPSASEIVFAVGCGERLVGRSHECDHPAPVQALPACTRASFPDGSSREIDDRVVGRVQRGLSLYEVDLERLRALEPEIVITQDQCRVCAVHLSELEAGLQDWTGTPVRIVSLSPAVLGDVWRDIVRVDEALGAGDAARRLTRQLSDRVASIGERTGDAPRPRVACLEWLDPLMAAGNWVPELVWIAGGRPVLGEIGQHSPGIGWRELSQADPDVLVVTACGFDLARSRRELEPLLARPEWRRLRAVDSGRVYVTDGNAYFNRSGPRLVESIEILAEILHPDRCAFGHAGRGFERAAEGPQAIAGRTAEGLVRARRDP